jgi:uncharacterized protein (TIRG00374 family)
VLAQLGGLVIGFGPVAILLVVVVAAAVAWQRRRTERASQRLVWWGLASVVLAVAAYALLLRFIGLDEAGQILASVDPSVLIVAIALELTSLTCLAQVYRSTFRLSGGTIDLRNAVTVSTGAFSFTQLLPGGGAVGAVYAARRLSRQHGVDAVTAGTTIAMTGLVVMGALGILVSVGATAAGLFSPDYRPYAAAAALLTVLLMLLAVLLRRAVDQPRVQDAIARLLHRFGPDAVASEEFWRQRVQEQIDLVRRPAVLLRPAGWAGLRWSLDLAVLTLIVATTGTAAPILAVVVAYGVANLLNGLPLTPGGIGLVETGVAGTLIAFGAEPAAAAVAAIGYRLVAHWLPVSIAAALFASSLRRLRPQEVLS